MSIDKVPMIVINLADQYPTGQGAMIVRCENEHVETVTLAATLMGMRQAELLRTLVISGAKKIIEENAR